MFLSRDGMAFYSKARNLTRTSGWTGHNHCTACSSSAVHFAACTTARSQGARGDGHTHTHKTRSETRQGKGWTHTTGSGRWSPLVSAARASDSLHSRSLHARNLRHALRRLVVDVHQLGHCNGSARDTSVTRRERKHELGGQQPVTRTVELGGLQHLDLADVHVLQGEDAVALLGDVRVQRLREPVETTNAHSCFQR